MCCGEDASWLQRRADLRIQSLWEIAGVSSLALWCLGVQMGDMHSGGPDGKQRRAQAALVLASESKTKSCGEPTAEVAVKRAPKKTLRMGWDDEQWKGNDEDWRVMVWQRWECLGPSLFSDLESCVAEVVLAADCKFVWLADGRFASKRSRTERHKLW